MDGRILALKAVRHRALPSHCHLEGGWPGYVAPPIDPARRIKPNPMYYVFIGVDAGHDLHLFFNVDPRPHGCPYPVVEGTDLDEPYWGGDQWTTEEVSQIVLARSTRRPNKFKAFRSELDVPVSGWEILDGTGEVWNTWEAFKNARPE